MTIGEAFLSAVLQVFFDPIASQPVLDFLLRGGLDKSRLEHLKHVLARLESVLDNAEEKQFTNESVRKWLHNLKAAVFDAEDLLDQIATKNLPSSVEPEPESQSWVVAGVVASRLNKIIQMLENMASRIPDLGLTAGAPLSTASQTRSTTSFVKESQVYGRKEEKDRIIQLLLSQENEKGGVAIVGMGGMGKTTLARSIYNDDRLEGRFDLKLWIYVSNDFDVVGVTRSALESITSKPCKLHSLETMQVELSEKLRGRKFLVVLDDVWSERIEDWELLCCPFNNGAPRIIVTTRNEGVADIMGGFPKVRLHKLSKDDGWSLLSRYAFQSGSSTGADSQLEKIGREIVEKCDGLPSAIKILGSPLRSKLERKHWEKVRDSNIWDLPGGKNDILPALSLSYCFLPSPLKRCFAYCPMFPKGYEFEKDKLVLLWMAEGFLDSPNDNVAIEQVGDECFMELLSRSFFDEVTIEYVGQHYVIHDLVHDLAKFVSGDFCAYLEQNKPWKIAERARHISYDWYNYDDFDRFEARSKARNVRSFLSLRSLHGQDSDRVTRDLLPELDPLRVLSLAFCKIIPAAIDDLKQLRHLDASRTEIKELPESICTLCNLQTLSLGGCGGLQELPSAIGNLKQLRHLDASWTEIKELPESICTLCNLQALSLGGCRGLQELPSAIENLKQLRHLDASWTEIKELPESICTLCNLQALSLGGCRGLQELPSAIGNLKQLRHLDASWTEIKELPESICTLCNLQALSLEGCQGLQELPSAIGNLKQLRHLDASVTEIKELPESICTLCNLQALSLQKCRGLQELPSAIGNLKQLQDLDASWTEIKELPESICTLCNLQALSLQKCRGLQELPSAIGNLKQLQDLDASWTEIKELPESICTLCNLQKLSLGGCRGLQDLFSAIGNLKQLQRLDVSSTEIKELPESICTLCNLQALSLEGCGGLQELPSAIGNLKQLANLNVSSTKIKELPESICTLCNLQALSLEGCRGLQELPSTIGNLMQLQRLDVSSTEIKELPESIGNLKQLRHLDVSLCTEIKELPGSICTLCNLQALSLEGCRGLQELPSAIGNLKQLQDLDASWTKIKELPESICTLCNLQTLLLGGCRGLQELPSAIRNLKKLQRLDELPSAIGNLKQHQRLDVSSTEIRNLKQLQHLDVSSTEIKELPESICTLCNLKTLSLEGCRGLQELPSAIGNLMQLEDLNASSTEIKELPESIGNLKQLRHLDPCNLHDLNTIQVELSEKLEGKKFLLVLDDVWSEKVEHWENLCGPFNTGAQGSRIIVTARNEGVAHIMGGFPKVRLHKLSKEDGWSLLSRYAFQSGSSTGADSQLVKIGQEIVEKCDGLPLAIKILGSLLHSKLERKHWEKVRDSNIWDLPGGKNNILPPLSLSYCSLPSRHKRCFAYCAMFPKGYEFEKDKLVLLWMAEGLLDSPNDNVAIEEVGDECFMELLSISFFDEVTKEYVTKQCYVIHDLVHDLAKFVSGDFCAYLE
ncbi:hypothetical protein Ancab_022267 [Ancistrocladus abbreviatus]